MLSCRRSGNLGAHGVVGALAFDVYGTSTSGDALAVSSGRLSVLEVRSLT
jgi:hypothetical protein